LSGSGRELGKLRVYCMGMDLLAGMVILGWWEASCIVSYGRCVDRRRWKGEWQMRDRRVWKEVHAVESSSGQSGRGIGSLGSEGDGSDGRRRRK
jgi:hypothetical protein